MAEEVRNSSYTVLPEPGPRVYDWNCKVPYRTGKGHGYRNEFCSWAGAIFRRLEMLHPHRSACMALLLFGSCAFALPSAAQPGGIEPNAGAWKTWVIPSGKDFRVPPPPDAAATAAELEQLRELVRRNDQQSYARIAFWDAGAPGYQWIELIN